MALYAACDLHSNNTVLAVIDDTSAVRFRQRLPNDLPLIDAALTPFRSDLERDLMNRCDCCNRCRATGREPPASACPPTTFVI